MCKISIWAALGSAACFSKKAHYTSAQGFTPG